MSCLTVRDLTPLRNDRSGPEQDVPEAPGDYLERRLHEARIQAAEARGTCSHAAHAGRAELYQLALSELRSGPIVTTAANPLLDQAREAGVID